jgi:hypothetical protein
MDTFIVRFYRRTMKTMQDLAGTVEHVGSGRRSGFAGERELLDRLLEPLPRPGELGSGMADAAPEDEQARPP